MVYRNYKVRYSTKNTVTVIVAAVIVAFFVGNFVYDGSKTVVDTTSQMKDRLVSEAITVQQNPTEQIAVSQRGYGITPYGVQNSQTVNHDSSSVSQQSLQTPIDPITLEHEIDAQINNARKQAGLQPLLYDEKLATIARDHSKDMAVNNYYDHTSPNGIGLQDRYRNAQYVCFNWMGENIQQQSTSDPNLANSAFQTWINSPEHKDNILEKNFLKEGIGVYAYSNTVFITEDFC